LGNLRAGTLKNAARRPTPPDEYFLTGSAGFIGSQVAEHLLERGNEAAIVDDLSSGKHLNLPEGVVFYYAGTAPRPGDRLQSSRHAPDKTYWSGKPAVGLYSGAGAFARERSDAQECSRCPLRDGKQSTAFHVW
jgi:hypothetical protein